MKTENGTGFHPYVFGVYRIYNVSNLSANEGDFVDVLRSILSPSPSFVDTHKIAKGESCIFD